MTGNSSSGAEEQPVSTPRPKRKIEVSSLITPDSKRPKKDGKRGDGNASQTPRRADGSLRRVSGQQQSPKNQSTRTPVKASTGTFRSTGTHGLNKKQVEKALIEEAKDQMREYLKPDIKGIVDVASPGDVTGKGAVTRTTNSITKLVDDLFRSRDSPANDREERSKQSIRDWLSRNSKSRMAKKLVDYLFSLFSQFQRLVPVKGKANDRRSSKGKAAENTAVKTERDMYDPVKSFV
ncbi:hypothetical protein LPJ74_005028, partial [Coemansia sp. RSA 1843]